MCLEPCFLGVCDLHSFCPPMSLHGCFLSNGPWCSSHHTRALNVRHQGKSSIRESCVGFQKLVRGHAGGGREETGFGFRVCGTQKLLDVNPGLTPRTPSP